MNVKLELNFTEEEFDILLKKFGDKDTLFQALKEGAMSVLKQNRYIDMDFGDYIDLDSSLEDWDRLSDLNFDYLFEKNAGGRYVFKKPWIFLSKKEGLILVDSLSFMERFKVGATKDPKDIMVVIEEFETQFQKFVNRKDLNKVEKKAAKKILEYLKPKSCIRSKICI